jgi:hypothetical protein
MDAKNIIELLNEHIINLEKLIEIALRKQKALIENNYDELTVIIKAEGEIISKLLSLEKQRIKLTNDIYAKVNINQTANKNVKLSVLLNGLISTKWLTEVQLLEVEIKNRIIKIGDLNLKNQFLLQQANQFITEVLSILFSNQKTIIDRKV